MKNSRVEKWQRSRWMLFLSNKGKGFVLSSQRGTLYLCLLQITSRCASRGSSRSVKLRINSACTGSKPGSIVPWTGVLVAIWMTMILLLAVCCILTHVLDVFGNNTPRSQPKRTIITPTGMSQGLWYHAPMIIGILPTIRTASICLVIYVFKYFPREECLYFSRSTRWMIIHEAITGGRNVATSAATGLCRQKK